MGALSESDDSRENGSASFQCTMNMQKKCVLVTGASGFIGGHLCRMLYELGAQIFGLVRCPGLRKQHLYEQHVVDIVDRQQVRSLVYDLRPDLVVHLAANKNRACELAGYRDSYKVNVLGSLNLIEACLELPSLTRFVFLGTCEEYGLQPVPFDETLREIPVSPYAVTKLAVTQLLQAIAQSHDFPAVILRLSVVYGPGQGKDMFLPGLVQALLAKSRFKMTRGEQTRDFVFIEDVTDAILRALTVPDLQGQVINISSAQPIRIEDIAIKAAQLIDHDAESLLDIGGREYAAGETMNYWASNQRAWELIKWRPATSLEDGLRRTVTYYRREIVAD